MASKSMNNIFNFLGKCQEVHILNNWKLTFFPQKIGQDKNKNHWQCCKEISTFLIPLVAM